jgi:hypothetical protein
MILAAVVSAALIVPISIDRAAPLVLSPPAIERSIPAWRKSAAIRPLVSSATDCIAHKVSADPRFVTVDPAGLNNLIVDSMPSCVEPLRAMIDAYDRLFGDGAGEKFFMGPYLDGLPAAVSVRVKDTP